MVLLYVGLSCAIPILSPYISKAMKINPLWNVVDVITTKAKILLLVQKALVYELTVEYKTKKSLPF